LGAFARRPTYRLVNQQCGASRPAALHRSVDCFASVAITAARSNEQGFLRPLQSILAESMFTFPYIREANRVPLHERFGARAEELYSVGPMMISSLLGNGRLAFFSIQKVSGSDN
jgi:hypothetical protein